MPTDFVHLRLHTEYSLIDSTVRVKKLIAAVAEMGMPAVGVTDQCNFYGLIKLYKAAQASGVKPIIGVDLWIREELEDAKQSTICLLAMNHAGYLNIIRLISRGFQEGQYHGVPYVRRDWLREHSEGVIVLSGGRKGDIGQALIGGRQSEALALLIAWQQDFPNRFYIELQRTGRQDEERYLHAAVELAEAQQIPVVATNEVCFFNAGEFEAHEARVCIGEGRTLDDPRRERRYSEQQYLRSAAEMATAYFFITALFNMPLANVTATLQALPLTVTLGGALFFREAVGWRRMSAILIGFLGMLLIVRPGSEGFNIYGIYALLAVLGVTVRDLVTRQLSADVPSMTVTLAASLTVMTFSGIASTASPWVPISGTHALMVIGSSICIFGGYYFSVRVMRVGDISFTAPFRYTGLIWALVLGWLVFGDWPAPLTLLGAATVVATGLFTLYRERAVKEG